MTAKRLFLVGVAVAALTSACALFGSENPDLPATPPTPGPATSVADSEPPSIEDADAAPSTSALDIPRLVETAECDRASDEAAIVCEAYDLIKEHYVDDIDDQTLAEAAAAGLAIRASEETSETVVCPLPSNEFVVACHAAENFVGTSEEAAEAMVRGLTAYALDPNSSYFDEEALKLLIQEQDGEIEGIGALVSPEDETIEGDNQRCNLISDTCRILIVSTIEGAPAEGILQRDDWIVGVNGEDITGQTVDEVTAQVRGPAGTDVVLTVYRNGARLNLTITRAAVEIPVIESETIGKTGYVRLRLFTAQADEQFKETVIELLGAGVKTLVIDLRNNPGGLLETAIEVASVFLEDGKVVSTEGPLDERDYEVSGSAVVPKNMEVVFIVNKGSASASEVVSAVLQENDLVTVVGENTFGKNTVQQRYNLGNGGALKLTVARWLTPGGLDFGGRGVTPDVELDVNISETTALVEAVLAAT